MKYESLYGTELEIWDFHVMNEMLTVKYENKLRAQNAAKNSPGK